MVAALLQLQEKISYRFTNPVLLEQALTHSSVANEISYERLEFLGDRVLGLVISDYLYKHFPREPEGHLAKRLAALVQGSMIADIGRTRFDLGQYIIFSTSEKSAAGHISNSAATPWRATTPP